MARATSVFRERRRGTEDEPRQSVLGPGLANMAISPASAFTQIDIVQTYHVIQSYLVHAHILQLIFSDDTPITCQIYDLFQNVEGSYSLDVPKHQLANM